MKNFFEITEVKEKKLKNNKLIIGTFVEFHPKGGSKYTIEDKIKLGYFGILNKIDGDTAFISNFYIEEKKIEILDEKIDLKLVKPISINDLNKFKKEYVRVLEELKDIMFKIEKI